MMSILYNKLKHLVLFVVSIFRRALCCFRKRRRNSFDAVPLTHVGVVANSAEPEENWNWNDQIENAEPKTIQDHIELYRKKKREATQQSDAPENQEDFFEDMAPRILRQPKLYVSSDEVEQQLPSSRLGLIENVPIETGELREWEENSGWEGETLDWDAQEALREKKRLEREKRLWEQQQKRMEKTNRLGSRVST